MKRLLVCLLLVGLGGWGFAKAGRESHPDAIEIA